MAPGDVLSAFAGKRVLLTGHTGFKGAWLVLVLNRLGAAVEGYSLESGTNPSMFDAMRLSELCDDRRADVRDADALAAAVERFQPHFVLHLAAQSLVLPSYREPLATFETNAMGTAHVLEALRRSGQPCTCVIVTSDKCYENREWVHGYREADRLGGRDVYSMSKAVAELVTSSYRQSFFAPEQFLHHRVAVASARAGNVIGGGDWAAHRLVPDAFRAWSRGELLTLRNPSSIRPWQHVLEALVGYLTLAARLAGTGGREAATLLGAWNFGPDSECTRTVREVVEHLSRLWPGSRWEVQTEAGAQHEAHLLTLSTDKARRLLGWAPRWTFADGLERTSAWYQAFYQRASCGALRELTMGQIDEYLALLREGSGGQNV